MLAVTHRILLTFLVSVMCSYAVAEQPAKNQFTLRQVMRSP
jgi:hypothetical protein